MERKEKQVQPPRILDERARSAVRWELTEEDKAFLRSCNINPD